MTTDLRTDEQLEQRLRAACHAVIPHLGESRTAGDWDDHDDDAYDHDEASTLATVTPFPITRTTGRAQLVGAAAAALLVAGGAAVWAGGRYASDDAGTVAQSQPVLPAEIVATVLATPPGSSVPCFDVNCKPLDRLPVVAGAADFYVGPESLGTAVVNQEMLDQVGIIRCLGLTAAGSVCQRIEGIAGVGLVTYPTNVSAPSTVLGDQAVTTVDIEVGTTFTDVSPADYANTWGSIPDGEMRPHRLLCAVTTGSSTTAPVTPMSRGRNSPACWCGLRSPMKWQTSCPRSPTVSVARPDRPPSRTSWWSRHSPAPGMRTTTTAMGWSTAGWAASW
jgi:hypothetical protein